MNLVTYKELLLDYNLKVLEHASTQIRTKD